MAAATIQLYAIAILASELIDDFDVSRARIGLLGAANTIVGALLSPIVGRVTDRIGAKRALITVLAGCGLAMFATALSPNYWVLIGASLLAGVPQAGG
ncbi:MAG: MFS transporter, partial [Acidimicrobiales bacterium]